MRRTFCVIGLLFTMFSASVLAANEKKVADDVILRSFPIDRTMSYQGVLKDALGNPVSDSNYSITFRIYEAPVGGSAIWTSSPTSVATTAGSFIAFFGPVPLPFDTTYYLSMQVQGDVEMAGRQRLTMSPYSAVADTANYAFRADTATYAISSGGGGASHWTLSGNVLSTNDYWGISRGGAGNALLGDSAKTMVNLGSYSQTGYGSGNRIYATVSGGKSNQARGDYSTVSGGTGDTAIAIGSMVGGGAHNVAFGEYSGVASGDSNSAGNGAPDEGAFIGGGRKNAVYGKYSSAVGGYSNTSTNWYDLIGGGLTNRITGYAGVIGGGVSDTVSADFGGVSSGYSNLAGNAYGDTGAFIGGGWNNEALSRFATVAGGRDNIADGDGSAVAGGRRNATSASSSFIGGGAGNQVEGAHSVIAGGDSNYVASSYSAIVGGHYNSSDSIDYCAIVGGYNNDANGEFNIIGNGAVNSISGNYDMIGSGSENTVTGDYNAIGSGDLNFVGGDHNTLLSGMESAVLGSGNLVAGRRDTVTGEYCYAFGLGNRISTTTTMSFAFGLNTSVNTDYNFTIFNSGAPGRVAINRDSHNGGASYPIHVGTNDVNGNGAYLSFGGTWTSTSSRTVKENFTPFDGSELLSKIADLSVTTWNYKQSTEKHVGPVAEEFVGAFDVGVIRESDGKRDDMALSASDVAGVALAGVQELMKVVDQQNIKIKNLEKEIESLKGR